KRGGGDVLARGERDTARARVEVPTAWSREDERLTIARGKIALGAAAFGNDDVSERCVLRRRGVGRLVGREVGAPGRRRDGYTVREHPLCNRAGTQSACRQLERGPGAILPHVPGRLEVAVHLAVAIAR